MPARDLDLLVDAAKAAGEIAQKYFRADPKIWDKEDGQGPVTEADFAVDQMLRSELCAARDYAWLSEETEDNPERLDAETVFIVDPIDGTRAFIEGSKHWAHSLAIVRNGQVETAVIYLPASDKLYSAQRGAGASLNGAPLTVSSQNALTDATVLATKHHLSAPFWQNDAPPQVTRVFRSSLAYRMSLVGEGRFDAMLTLRPTWEWDVAAGALIVEEAGGRVSDRSGSKASFNNPTPQLNGMVAGGAPVVTGLLDALL